MVKSKLLCNSDQLLKLGLTSLSSRSNTASGFALLVNLYFILKSICLQFCLPDCTASWSLSLSKVGPKYLAALNFWKTFDVFDLFSWNFWKNHPQDAPGYIENEIPHPYRTFWDVWKFVWLINSRLILACLQALTFWLGNPTSATLYSLPIAPLWENQSNFPPIFSFSHPILNWPVPHFFLLISTSNAYAIYTSWQWEYACQILHLGEQSKVKNWRNVEKTPHDRHVIENTLWSHWL